MLGGFGSAACAGPGHIAKTMAAIRKHTSPKRQRGPRSRFELVWQGRTRRGFLGDIVHLSLVQFSGTDMRVPHARTAGKNEDAPEDQRMAWVGADHGPGLCASGPGGCTGETEAGKAGSRPPGNPRLTFRVAQAASFGALPRIPGQPARAFPALA